MGRYSPAVAPLLKRSWIDRMVDWLAGLPIPWYVLAILSWLVLSILLALPLWLAGVEPYGSFPALTRVDPTYIVFSAVGYGYLARHARSAFDRFRPSLDVTDEAAAEYRHRISTLRPGVAWVILILVIGIVGLDRNASEYPFVLSTTTAHIVWGTIYSLGAVIVLFVALVLKQLREVGRLHRKAVHIDLFRPAPLHAFASLSARAGGLLVVVVTFGFLVDPVATTEPVWQSVLVSFSGLGAAAFFLPLVGLSRRLRAEKRRLLDESASRISVVRGELHSAAASRSFEASGDLRTMLSALSEDHDRIKGLSPWPWDSGTIRGFGTTLLLPIGTWLVTNLLNRALF